MPVPGDWVRTCPHCGSVKAAFQTVTQIITTKGSSAENRWWIVAKCPACGALVVAELNPNTQRVMAIYPEDVGAWPVGHLPAAVAREWEKATKVFRIGAYGSAVVACGRTLKAASLDLG